MRRYAVYAIPGADAGGAGEALGPRGAALRDTVESWFGRDEFLGLTVDARRYGFHATLGAPFRLAEGTTEAELCAAADAFAAGRAEVTIPGLSAAAIGGFRALLPGRDPSALNALAADVVCEFAPFRAALTKDDVLRRKPERLSPRQRELFEQWGYPYVLDEFRFHFTLTDPVPPERAASVDAALEQHFSGIAGVDVPLTAIVISVEPEPGAAFETLSVHPFADRTVLETA